MLSDAEVDRADGLLRAAEEASYRWPAGFGGLTANLTTDRVKVPVRATVRAPRDIDLESPPGGDAAAEESLDWARGELASMMGHRWPGDYAEGDGRWDKRINDAAANAAGDLIEFADDPFRSSYRVEDGHISEVHRSPGKVRFTIVIGARMRVPDGRHLPTSFSVYHWKLDDAGGTASLDHVDAYIDSYVEVEGVWLPAARRITIGDATGLSTRELSLSGHVLLGP